MVLATILGSFGAGGGALAVWGWRRFESTALHRALTTGRGLADLRFVDGPDATGDVTGMAMVTLESGRRYTFPAPMGPP